MKYSIQIIVVVLLALGIVISASQCTAKDQKVKWKEVRTVSQVCEAYPDRMVKMLEALNLDLEGLDSVKEAYKAKDISTACYNLLEYYKNGTTSENLRIPLPSTSKRTNSNADSIVQDIFTFQTVIGKVPRIDGGHLKWDHNGPEDDIEWAWALNRHYPVASLLTAYLETGNKKYVGYIDAFIKDWILESAPYPAVKSRTAMWRGLEVSFRVKMWAKIFYHFINTDDISPATQLLILSAIPDHAHYNRNFHGTTNWLTMEMTGLATAASAWPEFKESKSWLDYTLNALTESLKEQVYPDGTQTELTTHYHRVALVNFYLFYTICQNANIPLPKYFTDEIENMWDYLALVMRPDGNALLNNDSDLDYNKERIYDVAKEYNRDDWLYIASNGKEGSAPTAGPSFMFPYAGHFISRSGYEIEDHWSFFDAGPWGSGHQHNDKLHLSISAFGQDFLVDAGRFAYKGEVAKKFRGYSRGSAGHNVVLIDGKGQAPGPKLVDSPLSESHYRITPEYDYIWESFNEFEDIVGNVSHTRTMLYVRDQFWIVVDKIDTDRPRDIQSLWHWHPHCEVELLESNTVVGTHKGGELQVIPIGKSNWNVDFVKGQEEPEIQGWYSKEYNQYEPNVASIYNAEIESEATFAWLLFPTTTKSYKVKAELISKNKNGVKIRVSDPAHGTLELDIPYSNSHKVKVNNTK